MTPLVRIPRDLHAKPIHERAVTRFYRLLDGGLIKKADANYCGQDAAEAVAQEFNVPSTMVWRWVREHAEQTCSKPA